MQYSLHSQNLKALLPQSNYNLILNEQSSQKLINIEEYDIGKKTRRKSCHCSECGVQNYFQYKKMNVQPVQQEVASPKKLPSPPQLIVTSIESTKSTYLKSSYKYITGSAKKLSLEIYGIRKNVSRQNTLLKLITDGQERSKRRESSGLFSNLDLNSQKSLNMSPKPACLVKPTKSLHYKKPIHQLNIKPLIFTLPRLSIKK